MTDQAWVTLLVGVLVVAVAFNQWRVARAKFKLDLFDRRFNYYMLVLKSLRKDVRAKEDPDTDSERLMQEGAFLFGVEVSKFVRTSWLKRAAIAEKYAGRPDMEKRDALDRFALEGQFELYRLMVPYLSLGQWR